MSRILEFIFDCFFLQVCVKMRDLKNKNEFLWERNKFINRKYLMQEMYQNYVDGDKDWDLPKVHLKTKLIFVII